MRSEESHYEQLSKGSGGETRHQHNGIYKSASATAALHTQAFPLSEALQVAANAFLEERRRHHAVLPVDPVPPPPPTNVDSIVALCENRKVRGLRTRRALT